MRRLIGAALPGLVIIAVFAACYQPLASPNGSGLFSLNIASKSLPAALDPVIMSADIRGFGPSGAGFEILNVLRGTPVEFELVSGNWRVEARGKTSSGAILAFGAAFVMVVPEESTVIDIALEALPPLVAVAYDGTAYISGDAVEWIGAFPTGLEIAYNIAFTKGLYVAAGRYSSTYGVSTSTDGINWSPRILPGGVAGSYLYNMLANPAGELVATGVTAPSGHTFHSTDGTTWTGPYPSLYTPIGPAWLDGNWYVTNSNLSTWRRSSDGITWDGTGFGTTGMYGPGTLIGLNGRLIIGGGAPSGANKETITSNDAGASFNPIVTLPATNYIYAFAANPASNRLVAVGNGAGDLVHYSDDYGASWIMSTGFQGVSTTLRAAVHWKGGFITAGLGGTFYTSTDGKGFIPAGTAVGLPDIRGIAWNGAP